MLLTARLTMCKSIIAKLARIVGFCCLLNLEQAVVVTDSEVHLRSLLHYCTASPEDIGIPEARVVLQCVVMCLVLHDRLRRQIQYPFHRIPIRCNT